MTAPELVSAVGSARLHVLELLGNGIVGGMETYVASLVARLPRERFVVTAVCPYECSVSEQLREAGADVMVLPMPQDPLWSSIQAGCAMVRTSGVDVLHAHLPNAHLLAALIGRLSGRPVLATIHGRQLQTSDLEVHRAAGTFLSTVCRYSYFHALGMGVDARALSCIPNGVDTELYHPASPSQRCVARGAAARCGGAVGGIRGSTVTREGPRGVRARGHAVAPPGPGGALRAVRRRSDA